RCLNLVRPAPRVQRAAVQCVQPDGEQAELRSPARRLVVEVAQPALCDLGASVTVDLERGILDQTFDSAVLTSSPTRVIDSGLGRTVELAPVRGTPVELVCQVRLPAGGAPPPQPGGAGGVGDSAR